MNPRHLKKNATVNFNIREKNRPYTLDVKSIGDPAEIQIFTLNSFHSFTLTPKQHALLRHSWYSS